MDSLKRLAAARNIELLNILGERGIVRERKQIEVAPLAVERQIKDLETIRTIRKQPRTKREALLGYKNYIKNIKKENLSSVRLKEIVKTLEKREREAREERSRTMTPMESVSAFQKFARVFIITDKSSIYDNSFDFLNDASDSMTPILRRNKPTKLKLVFRCNMINTTNGTIAEFAFSSNIETNLESTDENELYFQMINLIEERIQKLDRAEGTGWRFYSVVQLELHMVEYQPLRGGSYISLYIKNKQAVINMKNKDEKCFLWCVLRALNLKNINNENIDRDLRDKVNTLDMGDIKYPVSIKDINKFESLNSNISIHVFEYNENDKIYPLRISKNADRLHNIDLLYISNGEKTHYCLIKFFNKLVSSQVSKHKERVFTCRRCLNPFPKEESLKAHMEYCNTSECIKTNMPEKGSKITLKNHWKSEKVPFIIYADMESILKPIEKCDSDPEKKYTQKYQKHEAVSFSYYIKSSYNDNTFEPRSYRGVDAMEKFVEWLEKDVKTLANIPNAEMIFGEEEARRFNKSTKCWICKDELGEDKVRDHCHYTGKYRGAAHNKCNLKFKKPKFIPVVFHNLSNYDAHLFVKNLGYSSGNINCIPNNEEKYISFTKSVIVGTYTGKKGEVKNKTHGLRFIDSYKFMAANIDKFVSNLLKRFYKGDKLNLLKRKGVYPYRTIERFEENKLPSKEAFYSKLNNKNISDDDYEHAKKVWDTFEMKNLGEYTDLYKCAIISRCI